MITIQQTRGREIEEIKPELVPVRGQMIIDTAERNFKVGDGETDLLTLPWWLHKPPKEVDGGVVVWTPPPPDGDYDWLHFPENSPAYIPLSGKAQCFFDVCFSLDEFTPSSSVVYIPLISFQRVTSNNYGTTIILKYTKSSGSLSIDYSFDGKVSSSGDAQKLSYIYSISGYKFGEKITIISSLVNDGGCRINIQFSYNGRTSTYKNYFMSLGTTSTHDQLVNMTSNAYKFGNIGNDIYNGGSPSIQFAGKLYFVRSFDGRLRTGGANFNKVLDRNITPYLKDGVANLKYTSSSGTVSNGAVPGNDGSVTVGND